MRCVVIGTTECARSLAKGILKSGHALVAVISLKKELLPNNSISLELFAREHGALYFEVSDINQEELLLNNLKMDILVCVWPKILRENIFKIPEITICAHPTELPNNRGRHALHWSKVLGLKQSALTFFEVDSGIDTGKIILQKFFELDESDTINTLNNKINILAEAGIQEILNNCELITNRKSQRQGGNYWRKRNLHDVLLDMRMSKEMIINIVKSFCSPYPCAKLIIDDRVIDIQEAYEVKGLECPINIEHGKVFNLSSCEIVAKCENGLIGLKSKNDKDFEFLMNAFDERGGGGYIYLSSKLLYGQTQNYPLV